jgi:hypothetical protein
MIRPCKKLEGYREEDGMEREQRKERESEQKERERKGNGDRDRVSTHIYPPPSDVRPRTSK